MKTLVATPLILLLTTTTLASSPSPLLPIPNTNNFHSPVATAPQRKRAVYETCEKTYGDGSVVCGDPGGVISVTTRARGRHAAPWISDTASEATSAPPWRASVAMMFGEDPRACAQRLRFTIPTDALAGTSSSTASSPPDAATSERLTTTTPMPTPTPTVALAGAPTAGSGVVSVPERTPSLGVGVASVSGSGSGSGSGGVSGSVSESGIATGSAGKPVATVPAAAGNGTLGKANAASNGTRGGDAEFQGARRRVDVDEGKWVMAVAVLGACLGFVL
ncbi:hypothetical protein BJ875DRAFT_482381 [Amylocarpus encephaloides]|uniref:Uncharacterized protein n=1 Tax=Amylocarpus encephaloides TaxID=45428 RepID=A0A9P7YMB9_9HELO|nr:hypothetical protein BJ875DRAFT_482381 [Amylocarpus encephaloides]